MRKVRIDSHGMTSPCEYHHGQDVVNIFYGKNWTGILSKIDNLIVLRHITALALWFGFGLYLNTRKSRLNILV